MSKVKFLKGLGRSLLAVGGGVALATPVFAFSSPDQNSAFYDVYDIFVKKIVQGPVGTAAGVACMVYGGVQLVMGKLGSAVLPIIGGGLLVKAEAIANSLGATINGL
ncbi:MAG: hypothetical protein QXR17_07590 [Candidatus Bathyarchaeia archaeon]